MPFADIEIRLALLVMVCGGSIQRLDRQLAEIKRGDRIWPDLSPDLIYAACKPGGGLGLVAARLQHVDPDRQVGRSYAEIPPVALPGLRPILDGGRMVSVRECQASALGQGPDLERIERDRLVQVGACALCIAMLVVTRAQRIEGPNVRESVHGTVEGLGSLGLVTREDVGLRELLVAVGLETVPGRLVDRTVLDECDFTIIRSKADRRFEVGFCLDE